MRPTTISGPKLVHVGCWAHARRKFVDAVKVNPQDAAAVAMVTRMDALFLIDRDARRRELSADERQAQRGEHAQRSAKSISLNCAIFLSAAF
jgi:transposase